MDGRFEHLEIAPSQPSVPHVDESGSHFLAELWTRLSQASERNERASLKIPQPIQDKFLSQATTRNQRRVDNPVSRA